MDAVESCWDWLWILWIPQNDYLTLFLLFLGLSTISNCGFGSKPYLGTLALEGSSYLARSQQQAVASPCVQYYQPLLILYFYRFLEVNARGGVHPLWTHFQFLLFLLRKTTSIHFGLVTTLVLDPYSFLRDAGWERRKNGFPLLETVSLHST